MPDGAAFIGDKPTALTEESGMVVGVDSNGAVRMFPLATPTDVLNGAAVKLATALGVRAALDDVISDLEVQIQAAASGIKAFKTWPELAAVAGDTGGQQAKVTEDNSSHTDPVTGETVDNAGNYRWSESPAGWEWISPLLDGDAVFDLLTEIEAARGGNPNLDARLDAMQLDISSRATAEQGARADSALQPNALVSQLTESPTKKILTADERTKIAESLTTSTLAAALATVFAALPTTPPVEPGKPWRNGEVIAFT